MQWKYNNMGKKERKENRKKAAFVHGINQNHQKSNKNKESSTNVAWEIVGECIIQPIEWASTMLEGQTTKIYTHNYFDRIELNRTKTLNCLLSAIIIFWYVSFE